MKTLRIERDSSRFLFVSSIDENTNTQGDCLPVGEMYDEIQIAKNVLEDFADARGWLSMLHESCANSGSLVIEFEPFPILKMMQHLVPGDWTNRPSGREVFNWELETLPSLYKVLLDAGWVPDLDSATVANIEDNLEVRLLVKFAELQGVPIQTMLQRLRITTARVRAHRIFDRYKNNLSKNTEGSTFSVITPISRVAQYNANLKISPGLIEVNTPIIRVDGAKSAAEALESGLHQCKTDYVLFCHQDVYFPATFGQRLNEFLKQVPDAEKQQKLLGFAGMSGRQFGGLTTPSGFVVDRLKSFNHPSSSSALSIDEFAIVLARDSVHKIDPRFGWHLWATDLCISAFGHGTSGAIIRLPLFHNSYNDYSLPADWNSSKAYFKTKYPTVGRIDTLCGPIE